ncbi:helix-turn-helix transcriptional regulator [Neobacillus sp. FSL H8-0543]|uniref:helix-turn-helix domain-containing protein n=1 Tax=Neobacillus sp. FSL H8-0543 TaxID=2954672 RepID=UPI00315864B7
MEETKIGLYIGIGLGRLKKERGWTQEKLAEDSNLNTRYIQDLLYNEKSPSLNSVYLIAKAFGMEIDDFLTNIKAEIVYKYPPIPEEKKTKKRPKS